MGIFTGLVSRKSNEDVFAPNGELKKAAAECKDTWTIIEKIKKQFDSEKKKLWSDEKKRINAIKKLTNFKNFRDNFFVPDDGFISYIEKGKGAVISGELESLKKLKKSIKKNIPDNASFVKFIAETQLLKRLFPNLATGYSIYSSIYGNTDGKLVNFEETTVTTISSIAKKLIDNKKTWGVLSKQNMEKIGKVRVEGEDNLSLISVEFNNTYNDLKKKKDEIKVIQKGVNEKAKKLFDSCIDLLNKEYTNLDTMKRAEADESIRKAQAEKIEAVKKIMNESLKYINSKPPETCEKNLEDCRKEIKRLKEKMDLEVLKTENGADLINWDELKRRKQTIDNKFDDIQQKVTQNCVNGSSEGESWKTIATEVDNLIKKISDMQNKINLAKESSESDFKNSTVTREQALKRAKETWGTDQTFNFVETIEADESGEKISTLANSQNNNNYESIIQKIGAYGENIKGEFKDNLLNGYMYYTEFCLLAIRQMHYAVEVTKKILKDTSEKLDLILGSKEKTVLDRIASVFDTAGGIMTIVGTAGSLAGVCLGAAGIPILGWIMVGVVVCATLYKLGTFCYDKYKAKRSS